MNNFAQYLTESEKEYSFRLKFADLPEDFDDRELETHLQKYGVKKLTPAKKTPIQSHPMDFQTMKNIEIWIMDTVLAYPVTPPELTNYLSQVTGVSEACIVVITDSQALEQEAEQDAAEEIETYEPILTSDYDPSDGSEQELVGDKRIDQLKSDHESLKFDFSKPLKKKDKAKFVTDKKGNEKSPLANSKSKIKKAPTANDLRK